MNTCERLNNFIHKEIESLKEQNAPTFIIDDHIHEALAGETICCEGCEKYSECFEGGPR